MHKSVEEFFGPVVYAYTREQAIEDGVLVDVTEMAKEAGIRIPVAVTRRLWDEYIQPNEFEESWGQSADGRLWDVLWMARFNMVRNANRSEMLYKVIFARQAAGGRKRMVQKAVALKAVLTAEGPNGGPCITIMLPDED